MPLKKLLAAAFLLLSSSALAQSVVVETPPPATAYEVPAPPPESAPPAPYRVRVRWGIDGLVGYAIPANAVAFGASARIGAQVLNPLGVYLDFGYTVGIGLNGSISGSGGAMSVSAIAMWHLAPMVEGDFGPWFIAAGPLIAGGGWGQVMQSVDFAGNASQTVIAAGGIMPGVDLRTGFTFGPRNAHGRLHGFSLGVDVKILSASVASVQQSSAGTQTVSVGDRVWGVAPMLVLGYDSK